jgi:polysaccharide pyruvyl transferase WcaK-like protein
MVREELSKRYLVEMGIGRALIHEVPDVAFILPEASAERINNVFLGMKIQGVLIGINVSQLLSFESKNYTDLMAEVADYLSTNLGATVLLIPHEIHAEKGNELEPPSDPVNDAIGGDDITAVRTVYNKVKEKQRIIPITEHDVDVIKGIIGKCDLFIGARTHSIISALSMGVPTLGIAYSQKTPGIMRMVGLGNYVCNFRTTTFEELTSKINDLFSKRSDVRRYLSCQVEILEKRVWDICDLIQNYVPNA